MKLIASCLIQYLAILLFITSCSSDSVEQMSQSNELLEFIGKVDKSYLELDTLLISLQENKICKLNLSLRHVKDIDSSHWHQPLIIPLLTSPHPIEFVEYPSLQNTNLELELIRIESNSGNFYYVTSIEIATIRKRLMSRYDENFKINYQVISESINGNIHLPVFHSRASTRILLNVDNEYSLKKWGEKVRNENDNEIGRFFELPKVIGSNGKSFAYVGKKPENEIFKFDIQLIKQQSLMFRAALPILIFLFTILYYWQFTTIQKRRKNQDLYNLLKNAISEKKRSIHRDIEEGKNIRLADIEELLKLDLKFGESVGHNINRLFLPSIITVIFILILLLVSNQLFGQKIMDNALSESTLTKSTYLDDLNIKISPDFQPNGNLDLTLQLKFLISSANPIDSIETVVIYLDSIRSEPIFKKDVLMSDDVDFEWDPVHNGYRLILKTKNKKNVSNGLSMIVQRDQNNSKEILSENKEIASKKPPYIEIEIPIESLEYVSFSSPESEIHKFPYDGSLIALPFYTDQKSFFRHIELEKTPKFISTPYINLKQHKFIEDVNSFKTDPNAKTHFQMIPNQVYQIESRQVRSKVLRIGLIIILLLSSIVMGWAIALCASFPDNKTGAFIIGAFGLAGIIPGLYKVLLNSYFAAVPNFFDLEGKINYADIMFFSAYVLCAIVMFNRVLHYRRGKS